MNRIKLFMTGLVLFAGCVQAQDPLGFLKDGQWVDLTWPFDEQSVYWPTNIPYRHEPVFEGMTDKTRKISIGYRRSGQYRGSSCG